MVLDKTAEKMQLADQHDTNHAATSALDQEVEFVLIKQECMIIEGTNDQNMDHLDNNFFVDTPDEEPGSKFQEASITIYKCGAKQEH